MLVNNLAYHRLRRTKLLLTLLILAGAALLLTNTYAGGRPEAARAAGSQETMVFIPVTLNGYPLSSVFGVQVHATNLETGLAEMLEAGADWIRYNGVIWSDIEPTKGMRNWGAMADLEAEFIRASQEGKNVIVIIRSTPTWAQKVSGAYCGPIKEQELASFGQFVHDAVRRYSQPPYDVKYWEIWNEPDVATFPELFDKPWGCWGDITDDYYGGGYFAEMLKFVYPNVKSADPSSQVIVGGLLLDCDPRPDSNWCAYLKHDQRTPKFLEGILRNNGAPYFDGVAFHGYDFYDYTDPELGEYYNLNWGSSWSNLLWDGSSTDRIGPVSTYKAGYLVELLNSYNTSGKYLLNTEGALICGANNDPPGGTGCEEDENSLFQQTKARYIPQAFAAATRDRLGANIWYDIFGWRNSALLDKDLSPLPAYYAYDTASEQIGGATFSRNVSTYPGVQIYEFERYNRVTWLVWSIDGTPHTISLPTTPDEVVDFMGSFKSASSSFTVTLDPHYIIWYP